LLAARVRGILRQWRVALVIPSLVAIGGCGQEQALARGEIANRCFELPKVSLVIGQVP
jgi:hypothetical protein